MTAPRLRILVVDDELDILNLLAINLRREGFDVVTATSGEEALEKAAGEHPDLVVLDLMLPDILGTEVCRRIRANAATREIPVLMLTARGEEVDRVVGFEVGADDYVTKPFSLRELVLRVRAILRRAPSEERPAAEELKVFGPLRIDPAAHRVWVEAEELQLTATEFKLLWTLVTRQGRVQTRGQLLEDVWDMPPDLRTRTVDTHVKRLREKLGAAADMVNTVRGAGYRFDP